MYRKILVAFDGSIQAHSAFRHGLEIAACGHSELIVASVVHLPEPGTRVELDATIEDSKRQFEEGFGKLRSEATERGIELRTEVLVGHPAEQLIQFSEREGVDLVVTGRRGRSTFDRWLIGSVSTRLLRYAHCPVLVVR